MSSSTPNQPIQNYEIVNPTLEQQVATLLPSVAGYGGNLRSTNTIIPIVDLTTAAEGSTLPFALQTAWDFATGYARVENTTSTLVTNTGFWQVDLNFNSDTGGATRTGSVFLDDGTSQKVVWEINTANSSANNPVVVAEAKFIVFLRAGDELKATSSSTNVNIDVWYRQIADIAGTLSDPLGFA